MYLSTRPQRSSAPVGVRLPGSAITSTGARRSSASSCGIGSMPQVGSCDRCRPLCNPRDLSGNADIFTITGNYRYELRGRLLGTYLIGGGGWYLRNTNLSKAVTVGPGTICTTAWLWWGFTCTSGTVTASQTVASSNSSALGANAGMGLTVRVGEAPYRLYTEARYNYAPTKNISTQFITVAVGIRY